MTLQPTAFRNILFPLASYPVATSGGAIERAIAIASQLEAHMTGVAFEMDVRLPAGVYADMYSLGDIIAAEYQRGSSNANSVIGEFQASARRQGISHDQRLEQCVPAEIAERTVQLAHLNDLSVVAVKKDDGGQRDIIEALLFGAGRPVLLFPEAIAEDLSPTFERIAIAWDNKGPAARAVADALPFLRSAKTVRLLTVENERGKAAPSTLAQSAKDLARNLGRHNIEVTVVGLDAKGDASGDVLIDDILKNKTDLLVMGAYGHARLKEVVLGGTTDTILRDPPGYVLLSR
jgi:nucleotide-binding universal stress UspA family protein